MTQEVKIYEVDDFRFRFRPDGDPMVGVLATEYPEHAPYAAHVSLAKPRSRREYARDAAQHSGMDGEIVERVVADLCSRRFGEIEAAVAAEVEGGDQQESVPEVDQKEIDALVGEPGVLERFVEGAARCSGVIGERELLRLQGLAAFSAQLDPMPNSTPLAANVMLTGPTSRGKNHILDAVAKLLPENFFYAFESASGKALYYAAEDNPAFLRYHWLFPNEAEGVDLLVELLRPLLSGGKARHRTVNRDENGRNVFQEFDLVGPVSVTIPTVRNKLDRQLLTRLLVAGLEDYAGRVAAHSRAVSDQLSIDHASEDHAPVIRAWQAALLSLTGVRRVVLPVSHPDFCFDSDQTSHGARVWTNVLGLMCAHAWLEQRNRNIIELANGEKAIVARAEDYEVAYRVFSATCERSVMNVSDTHRKILTAVWVLQQEQERDASMLDDHKYYREAHKPFAQRTIAEASGVPQSTISENKSYLVQSLRYLEEGSGGGLRPVEGAEPSWWDKGDALDGFPRPEQVRLWWHGEDSDGPGGGGEDGEEDGLNNLPRGD